jgi:hypothetical protein
MASGCGELDHRRHFGARPAEALQRLLGVSPRQGAG